MSDGGRVRWARDERSVTEGQLADAHDASSGNCLIKNGRAVCIINFSIADESAGQWRPETNQSSAVDFVGFVDGQRHRRREDYVAGDRQAFARRLSRPVPRVCDSLLANSSLQNQFLAKRGHLRLRQLHRLD